MWKEPKEPACKWCGGQTELYKLLNHREKTIYKYLCRVCGHTINKKTKLKIKRKNSPSRYIHNQYKKKKADIKEIFYCNLCEEKMTLKEDTLYCNLCGNTCLLTDFYIKPPCDLCGGKIIFKEKTFLCKICGNHPYKKNKQMSEKELLIKKHQENVFLLSDFSGVFTRRGVNRSHILKSIKQIPIGNTLCKVLKNHVVYLSDDKDRLTTGFLKKMIGTSKLCKGVPE